MDTILEMLSHNFDRLNDRITGPLNFRLFVMPTVVTILAIRAHLKDIREGKPTFLWAFLKSASERQRLLRSGLKDFGRVFIFACVLDTTYQFLFLRGFYPLEILLVAVLCAIVPYFLVRGPIIRTAVLLYRKWVWPVQQSEASPEAAVQAQSDSPHSTEPNETTPTSTSS